MKSPNLNRAMKQKIRTTLQCVRSGSYLRSSVFQSSVMIFSCDLQISSDFQRLILAVLTIIAIAAGSFSTVW